MNTTHLFAFRTLKSTSQIGLHRAIDHQKKIAGHAVLGKIYGMGQGIGYTSKPILTLNESLGRGY